MSYDITCAHLFRGTLACTQPISKHRVPDYTLDLVVTTPLHKWSMLTPKRPIRVCVEYRAAFECQGVHNVLEYLQASTTDTI